MTTRIQASTTSEIIRPFGATIHDRGISFRVFSPQAKEIAILANDQRFRCKKLAHGFWELTLSHEHVKDGDRYWIEKDKRLKLADPASLYQPDGALGASQIIDYRLFNKKNSYKGISARDLVLYELHLGTFSPQGTYPGAEKYLDHLQHLGINAIKLMPLAAAPGKRSWGYDGVFHFAPFTPYGPPEELFHFVQAAHQRNIAVILDVVTNHFGPEGNTMWQLARSFFHQRNNTPWGPGPRFDQEIVLNYFAQMVFDWISFYDIDGFRLDAVHAIAKPQRHKHLKTLISAMKVATSDDRELHLILESTENESSLLGKDNNISISQLNFDYQRSFHRLLTRESHMEYQDYDSPAAQNVLKRGFHFAGDYSPWRKKKVGEKNSHLDWCAYLNYLTNHDSSGNRYHGERLHHLISKDAFRAATALLLLHPAPPYLFMGQEWACSSPFYFFVDFPETLGKNIARNRLKNFHEGDFTHYTGSVPPPNDPRAFEASKLNWDEILLGNHRKHLDLTTEIIKIRKNLRPQMEDHPLGINVQQHDLAFFLTIPLKNTLKEHYWLIANFNDYALEDDLDHATLIFSTRPNAPLAGETTSIFRCGN